MLYCFLLLFSLLFIFSFFFFNDTATTEIYTLSLHDALPISLLDFFHFTAAFVGRLLQCGHHLGDFFLRSGRSADEDRSEEHTSELQSRLHLVCRLLLEKKKKTLAT